MKFNKCFYCDNDRLKRRDYVQCSGCKSFSNFQPKKRMSEIQAYEYKLVTRLEAGISPFDMSPQEAIRRIKDHIHIHKIGEHPHFHLYKALSMAIEALEKTKGD